MDLNWLKDIEPSERDPRLEGVCCEVCSSWTASKEVCQWSPCPPNLDCYTREELRQLMDEDPHRVDQAVAVFTAKPERHW